MVNKGIVLEILDFELGHFLEGLGHGDIGKCRIFNFLSNKKKF